ncbi:type VI secretion system amidase effector protein Tae4 [Paraburkholderia sediminicola]|uniref:type VI secretion system amidase effector protein Tae4 n=1 Tax=Paraburkholderia sediminicola TaxID=458836 RepID=UPI0038B9C2FB
MPNKPTVVQTNSTPGSIKVVELKVLTFQELWDNYPSGDPYDDPTGQYKNQCAIRMSVAFHRVGIAMLSFSQKLVKPAPRRKDVGRLLLDGKPTATRAYELAEWMQLRPIAGLQKAENVTGPDWVSKVEGRTGILFFYGYWHQDGDPTDDLNGGHIDLWNGEKLTGIGTGLRVHWNIVISGIWSDFRKSKTILFFPIR